MKTDLYTKIVLSVIAACLLALVLQGASLIPAAHAQYGETEVVIAGVGIDHDRKAKPLNVRIVSIEQQVGKPMQELMVRANLQRIGGEYIHGSVPVEIIK